MLEAFVYAGISWPLQKLKDEICAGINEGKNKEFLLLRFKKVSHLNVENPVMDYDN